MNSQKHTRRDFMKTIGLGALVAAAPRIARGAEPAKAPLPNIVLFMADDMGIGDTSAYQDWTRNPDDQQIDTPSMERLARMGLRFTDAHTPSTVCSPTRYGLLTGRYSWRSPLKHSVMWGPQADPLIPKERPTIATMLREAGYNTGMSGKWHLGLQYRTAAGEPAEGWDDADLRQPLADTPLDHGFDYCFLTPRSHGSSAMTGWIEGRRVLTATGESEKTVAGYDNARTGSENFLHAQKFLEAHLADSETRSQPFFLYYAANSNHTPHTPSKEINGVPVAGQGRLKNGARRGAEPQTTVRGAQPGPQTERRVDFVYENDVAVGQLMRILEAAEDPRNPGHALFDNTLFIFTSDNGSEKGGRDSVGPLRGKKAQIYEGGHRVPFIACWKQGGIGDGDEATPGATSDQLLCLVDLFATFAALAGQPMEKHAQWAQDSENRLPVLLGGKQDRAPLVLHDDGKMGPALALRQGPWKLIIDGELVRGGAMNPVALYNLQTNPLEAEKANQIEAPEQQARVAAMAAELQRIFDQGFDPEIIYPKPAGGSD